MHALYGYCDFTVMPSVYEGFGMPAMESICTVTPMTAGKGTSMEEILGKTGTYFDPLDPDSIADALVLMNSEAYRNEKIAGYSKQLKKFIPITVVKQHFKIYKRLVKM
jgi:alpha-1,3-rhamnosyl/mannosyltransferase